MERRVEQASACRCVYVEGVQGRQLRLGGIGSRDGLRSWDEVDLKLAEVRVCRVGRSATVELKASLGRIGDGMGRLQGRQKWLGGMLDGEAPVSCPGHVVGTCARRFCGLVVWS